MPDNLHQITGRYVENQSYVENHVKIDPEKKITFRSQFKNTH